MLEEGMDLLLLDGISVDLVCFDFVDVGHQEVGV